MRVLAAVVVSLLLGIPSSASAQTINLRDLLTDFLRQGITLAPPPVGFSHSAHFIGADSPQFLALQEFNTQLGSQLSSFPLASSAGGFTYRFDPALGVLTRTTDSFGPIFAERADTIGTGKFNLGLNYNHFTFDRIDRLDLRAGDVALVFTHQDTNNDGSNLQFFFEGDVITANLFLKVSTDITAFVATYGVTDRFDIGAAFPIVRVDIQARSDAVIQRLATDPKGDGSGLNADTHKFANGTTRETITQSGSASGVGDIVLRAKYRLVGEPRGGLAVAADVRVPTGDERDLLGTGALRLTGSLIGSAHLGSFSPHINAGYTWADKSRGGGTIPDEINYTVGFDVAAHPRLTFAFDVIGRDFRNSTRVTTVNTDFAANSQTDARLPPIISHTTFPRLTLEPVQNLNTLLGSAGFKFNPFGNLLVTVNALFSIKQAGLQDRFTPLVALDYSF